MSEGHFEAKNYALRKSKDGVIVSFVVHPNDVTPELLNLEVGAHLVIEWKEYSEDGESVPDRTQINQEAVAALIGAQPKPRRKFSELSLPEQAGIRSTDETFTNFLLKYHSATDWGSPADFIRQFCGIKSRAELSTNHEAANKWRQLESAFQTFLTDHQYAESIRWPTPPPE